MSKKKAILIISIIAGAGIGGFFAWYFLTGQDIPACTADTPFTAYPVNMTRLKSIAPLGNLNPPGHTFPTDHMYFNVESGTYTDGFEIFAPGDITITSLAKVTYNPPQVGIAEDYTIEFRVCRELTGKFGHVNNLSALLLNNISTFGASGDYVQEWEVAGRLYTSYRKSVNLPVNAGTELGRAGYGGGYDFWLKDTRINLNWVNKEWPHEFLYTACPLVYFTPSLRTTMEAYLKDYAGNPVNPINYCGKIDFDIAGTGQGIWVRGDYTPSSTRAEDIGLALVYSNFNVSKGAISIGIAGSTSGTYAWDENVYNFTPLSSGYGNRSFNAITPDGNVYFYFCEQFGSGGSYTKVILIKMSDANHVSLQFIDNGVTPLPSDPRSLWSDPAASTYFR